MLTRTRAMAKPENKIEKKIENARTRRNAKETVMEAMKKEMR